MAFGGRWLAVYPLSLGLGVLLLVAIFVEHGIVGGNNPITSLAFCVVYGLCLLWLLSRTFGAAALPVPRIAGGLFALCLVLAVAMPLLGAAVDPAAALQEAVKLGGLGCVFLVAAAYGSAGEPLYRWAVRLGLTYLLIFLGLHFVFPDTVLGVEKFTALGRFTGSFVSANTAASLAAILLILAAASLIGVQRSAADNSPLWWRQAADVLQHGLAELLVIVIASGALVLTVSRAGIALGFVGVAVLTLWQALVERRTRGSLSPLLLVAAPMLAALAIGGGALVQRLGRTADAASLRGEIFQVHWRIFQDAPLFGHGLGGFSVLNRQAAEPRNFELLSTVHAAHNVYLQWLEQAGLVGAALMFGAIAMILAPVIIAALSPSRTTIWLRATVIISAVLLTHGLLDYALEVPSIAAFWTLLLGLAWGAARPSLQSGTSFAESGSVAPGRHGARA